jgi:hypothetical protein
MGDVKLALLMGAVLKLQSLSPFSWRSFGAVVGLILI